jgi:hypothetical protein
VWIGDNIGHLYAAGENNRAQVTSFCSGIIGLVQDRPFCPILIGHTAKAIGSEYSGSTAWENAARMRWYLSDTLPDQEVEKDLDDPPESNRRFLSKRKSNYGREDYVQLKLDEHGILIVDQAAAEHEIGRAHV